MYLIGYVVGPLLFGPLSETYGRKLIMMSTFFMFTIFTMGCALTQTWAGLLVFRFLAGVNASSPISVVGGIYADIYNDPVTRGRSLAVFMGVSLPPFTPPTPQTNITIREPA
jgi:MFS family permease